MSYSIRILHALHLNTPKYYTVKLKISNSLSLLQITMANNRYCIDLAKRGTAACKECKAKVDKGVARIAKIIPNPFTESGGEMKQWFHVRCIFEKLSRARATTKKIESTDDLEGWDDIADECKPEVLKCLAEFSFGSSSKKTPLKKGAKSAELDGGEGSIQSNFDASHKDNSFREFRKLVTSIADESKYLEKTAIIKKFFTKGSDGKGFKGDLGLWVKLLLPGVEKRVYNLQNRQLVKLFSEIFHLSHEEMLEDLDQGDVAKTVATFFEDSTACPPAAKSTLNLQEVDKFLEDLCKVSKEAEQSHVLKKVTKRCTGNDLQMFIRFIKHDLRINAGPKPILDAIHNSAYEAFQASRNLEDIINNVLKEKQSGGQLTVQSSVMTPVLPMLAMVCGSVAKAFERIPNGFFVEIKYDGERVQLHKRGNEFSYFSRSLKPVMPYKVQHLKDYIPKAFPHGNNLILDCEILLVSNEGIPLPFGSLGAHKKTAFKDATVCLFVFDCLQFNDENLMKKPLVERRDVLLKNMTEIKNHIMFSEMKEINEPKELRGIINSVIQQGLEGIVIKDKMGVYEPGKRHWLKVKKDYLKTEDLKKGIMPDTADLVVLGAYYGSGKFGGKKSIFLMGCLDEYSGKWCTVTKVKGFTDDVLEQLQTEFEMVEIKKNADLVPSWLRIKKTLVPDFVIKDVEKSAVWEIIGTEFTKADAHTANGISIRFPRVKCFRDKHWKQSTTLKQLQNLYEISKQTTDRVGLEVIESTSDEDMETAENSAKKTSVTQSPGTVSKSENEVLPNIFTGVKLFIPSSVKDADTLQRYFIAFDGVLLKEHEKESADVVIHPNNDESIPENAELVTIDWLWACIKLKKILPTKQYRPKDL